MKDLSSFLTPDEMASALRVSLSWVYGQTRLKGKNTIPVTRVGKYLRFDKEKVLDWIQAGGATAKR